MTPCVMCHLSILKIPFHPLFYPPNLIMTIASCLHRVLHTVYRLCTLCTSQGFTLTLRVADRTVLLMNPSEVPADFVSVAEQLSCVQHSQRETYITLIKHAFQSTLGTKYPLHSIHRALQVSVLNGTVLQILIVKS